MRAPHYQPTQKGDYLPSIQRRLFATDHSRGRRGRNHRHTLDLTFLDSIFDSDSTDKIKQSYDVILLNSPRSRHIAKLCHHSNTVICADGGANSLFESMDSESPCIPRAIVGDLDSIRPHVLDHFVERGSEKIWIDNQEENDFEKSLHYLLDQHTESPFIICWGAFGDRFDHEIQSFNVMYKHCAKADDSTSDQSIFAMTDRNFAVLLNAGKHRIECAECQGPFCGVLPLYSAATVSSKGLKYEMNEATLQFGGLISSSNGIAAADKCIEIETDQMIVFHTSCSLKEMS